MSQFLINGVVSQSVQSVFADEPLTTLSLTPSIVLTDGFYDIYISIKSLSAIAVYYFFINSDITQLNYRRGYISSGPPATGANISSTSGTLSPVGVVANIDMKLFISNGIVSFNSITQSQSSVAGRTVADSGWHTSAMDVNNIQMTSTVESTIDTGSYITLKRAN